MAVVSDSSEIIISNSINEETRIFLNINIKFTKNRVTKDQHRYLKWHREHVFKPSV